MIANLNTVNPTQLALPPPPIEDGICETLPAHILVDLLRSISDNAYFEEWVCKVSSKMFMGRNSESDFRGKLQKEARIVRESWQPLLEQTRDQFDQNRNYSDLTIISQSIEFAGANGIGLPCLIPFGNWLRVVRYVQKSRVPFIPPPHDSSIDLYGDFPVFNGEDHRQSIGQLHSPSIISASMQHGGAIVNHPNYGNPNGFMLSEDPLGSIALSGTPLSSNNSSGMFGRGGSVSSGKSAKHQSRHHPYQQQQRNISNRTSREMEIMEQDMNFQNQNSNHQPMCYDSLQAGMIMGDQRIGDERDPHLDVNPWTGWM